MGLGLTTTALEWTIFVVGIVAFGLALWSLRDAWQERRALRLSGQNGLLASLNLHHTVTAGIRLAVALFSVAGGLWLVSLPTDPYGPALIAKHCWLFYSLGMTANLAFERWATTQPYQPKAE